MGKCSDGHAHLTVLVAVILAVVPVVSAFAKDASKEPPPVGELAAALDQSCRLPDQDISIPDGARTTETEMLVAQTAVRHFDAAITAYTFCLVDAERRILTQDPELATTLGTARAERNNAAVQRAEELATAFNEALRIFRTRGYRPPVMRKAITESDRAFCDPLRRFELTMNVDIRLSATGEVNSITMPQDVANDVKVALRCIARRYVFDPATFDAIPQPAEFTLPINLGTGQNHITAGRNQPAVLNSQSQIIAARYRCVPPDLARGGEVGLYLKIGPSGKVVDVKTMVSSGVDAVDQAATCIAQSLKYEPPQVGGKPAEMSKVPIIINVTSRTRIGSADNE